MGYFGNGFVFTVEPAWPAIADALPDQIALRAYRHRNDPIWLLDAWDYSSQQHSPFTEDFPENLDLSLALPQETTDLLHAFSEICTALQSNERPYGSGWLRICTQMSLFANMPSFFFAADDDLTDMACTACNGMFNRFRVRFDGCAVEYSSGKLLVVPFESEEEDYEQSLSSKTIEELSRVPGVAIASVGKIEDRSQFYGSALQLWPAGDPVSLLGVGTWDPFEQLDRDFHIVFERVPSFDPRTQTKNITVPTDTVALQPKLWWQFWR